MDKLIAIVVLSFSLTSVVFGQGAVTLEECYKRAEENYPLIAQRGILQKTKAFSVENAAKGRLPQIVIGGQATYQSDVVRIPVEMPGVEPLDKDQYRIFTELSQVLYHGGVVEQHERAEEANAAAQAQEVEVQLYQLRDRIIELFFGILLLEDQKAQSELVRADLATALKRIEAGVTYGTAMRSSADALKAELLRIDQRIIEFQTAAISFREILGLFINQPLDENARLVKPAGTAAPDELTRPELRLFEFQKQALEANRSLMSARKKPRIELFLQGGYGKPALNMLENAFDFYYVGGIRLNWMISGYYTYRRENEILNLRQQSLDVQRETFIFNTGLASRQHQAEIAKLQRLLAVDEEIIALRESVQKTASAQLQEGVISATDYIREVNASDQAKQARALHETQMLMAEAKYRFTRGQ